MDRFGDIPEVCDLCGALVPPRDLAQLRVPDSSAVTTEPELDGERLLRACGRPRLVGLAAVYQHRLVVDDQDSAQPDT
ncbi:hypothetical protein [Kitasatospora sp. MBT63]|uniref:hypothetical protein n=1 Tax=Kitasatospora sp. MBT63 TaxID=1444768 RepID=UPI00068F1E8D|nr:hypothetical protein [Kitasatospora sp. MBT63]